MLHVIRSAIARIGQLFRHARLEREQDEEFQFHLDMEIAHNKRAGMSDDDARRAALLAFGGRDRFREEARDARGVVMLDNLVRDVRFALRRIRRAPGFAFGAIATLGIGIGAAAGIGTIVYGVLLRDLPYKDADRLVRVSLIAPGLPQGGDLHSSSTFVHLASNTRSLSAMSAHVINDAINITDGDPPERTVAGMITPSVFALLGVTPLVGKTFAPNDTNWYGGTIPILMSERLWRRRYGADPSIIGRRVGLNYGEREVIGILPSAFDYPDPRVDVWYPLSVRGPARITDRYAHTIGRLAPGVSIEQAQAELNELLSTIPERYPVITTADLERAGARIVLQPLKAFVVAPVRGHLILLGIMVMVVLIIAGTNVANLFLLRAEHTRQETAIAISLGADRLALAQRFVVEGMLLGAASTVVAIPVAAVAVATKLGFGAREVPRLHEVGFGIGTAVAIVLAALVLGALVGAAALTRARSGDVAETLRGGSRSTGNLGWRRVQRGLVTVQVAIALALLAGAALLGRSFVNLSNASLGFDPANSMTFGVSLPFNPYSRYPDAVGFHARMADRLTALPGVTAVATVLRLPLTPTNPTGTSMTFSRTADGRDAVAFFGNLASANYFDVMGIPIRGGRTFAPGDLRATEPAVILSARLARDIFGGDDPVGRLVYEANSRARAFRVVGLAGNVPGWRIEDGPAPDVYFPILRDGDGVPRDSFRIPFVPRSGSYVIRGTAPTAATIRGIMRELDPKIPAVDVKSLDALVGEATARVRLTMVLLGVAAAAALMLGIVGVYSVVSYAAAGRMREFGVRLALGDTAAGVRRLVLRDGLALASAGILAGVALALVGGRFLRSLLYQVSPTSPRELAAAVALLVVVTLLATLAPARRAARTDPALVLRGD